jgi:hypothetical protein
MEKTALAGRRVSSHFTFKTYVFFRVIYPNNSYANWTSATFLEFHDLVPQIINHAVYLLDHRLRQDLHLDTDFNCSYSAPRNPIALVNESRLARDNLSERPVPAPGLHTVSFVCNVQHASSFLNLSRQLR